MIKQIDGLMGSESGGGPQNLNIERLMVGAEVYCVAYVLSVELRMAKTEKGYAVFYLKDENANLIAARLFDVADYMDSGAVASAFEGRPACFRAKVQDFAGKSLVIDGASGISGYTKEFDYGRFVGRVPFNLDIAERLHEEIFDGRQLPVSLYGNYSVKFLAHGRTGAFAKLLEMTFTSVLSAGELQNIDLKVIAKVFFAVMEEYYNILRTYKDLGGLARMQLFRNYRDAELKHEDIAMYVIDTLQAMFEKKQPQHLYAEVISLYLADSMRILNLAYGSGMIPNNSKSRIFLTDFLGNAAGGVDISKY